MNSKHKLLPAHSSSDEDDDDVKDQDTPVLADSQYNFSKYNTQSVINRFAGDVTQKELELGDDPEFAFKPAIFSKTKKIVIPIFIIIAIAALIMMISVFVSSDDIGGIIAVLSICAMTWFGAIIGMVGTYLWGSVEDAIDYFKQENDKYHTNLEDLKGIRSNLRDETKGVFFAVGKLSKNAKDLERHLEEFDELRRELSEICESNEELNEMMDAVNKQYEDLVNLIGNNERAQLLSIYYEVSTKDREDGLSAWEYERFLGRLNGRTREYFEKQGSFDVLSGDDDIMDLQEFEKVLDKVIEEQQEEAIQQRLR